jgi:hypothetical protein
MVKNLTLGVQNFAVMQVFLKPLAALTMLNSL